MGFESLGIGPKNFQVVAMPSLLRSAAAALVDDSCDICRVEPDDQARSVLGGLGIGF